MFFELNCGYYIFIFYNQNIDFCPKSKFAKKLLPKLQKQIVCYKNIKYA